jgi:hypothetical protein
VSALVAGAGAQIPAPGTQPLQHPHADHDHNGGVAVTASEGNAWFEATRLDLGTLEVGHNQAVGHFKFRNPRSEKHTFRAFVSNCTCASAEIVVGDVRYDFDNTKRLRRKGADGEPWAEVEGIEVGPGQTGEVLLTLDMEGHRGVREATLRFDTDDRQVPYLSLAARSNVPMFRDPGGNLWFDATYKDLGVYFEGERAEGTFTFKNPRDVVHNMRAFIGSCTCSNAIITIGDRVYEYGKDKTLRRITMEDGNERKTPVDHINIEPGEQGKVVVHMDMVGIRGPRDADLQFQTSDNDYPVMNLKWRATGSEFFVVTPADTHLAEMSWQDKRDFQFEISSPVRDDFNIVRHDPLPPQMQIEMTKQQRDGRTVYSVKGTYGPGVDERAGGGTIVFHTDVEDRKISARVIATIKGPLTMEPGGFVSFGQIRLGEGAEQVVTIAPTDDFDLQVTNLEVVRLGVKPEDRDFVQFSHHKEGKAVKVVLKILDKMPRSYVNGILKVHLNHPSNGVKEIMFNGFVR